MKANPGGQIAPDEVVGRDELIQSLWRALERQSVLLTAERRIGKTCVVKKMVSEAPRKRLLPIYRDLEGIRTPLEFVETVFHDVEAYLTRIRRVSGRVRELLAKLCGVEIGGFFKFPDQIAPHWKTLLEKTIQDLVENQDATVILFWDEIPLMLHNIKHRSDEEAVMEILDTLRSLRQMHPELRMVFTGSIGFHNVIAALKGTGYANAPTNDMHTVEVPPLALDEAAKLAGRLLEGEGIQADKPAQLARLIAEAADGIPFFIHHIVDQMVQLGRRGDASTVCEIVDNAMTDPTDPWQLNYYHERIKTYYSGKEVELALALLDVLAGEDQALSFPDLFNRLKSQMVTEDKEAAREVLTLLQRDHYVTLKGEGRFRFRFPIIQRCWRMQRGAG
jgi:hypothetical protein